MNPHINQTMNKLIPNHQTLLITLFCLLLTIGCKHELSITAPCIIQQGSLTDIAYQPIPRQIATPFMFPQLYPAQDNPMTEEGIELGRRLFYDPILSVDSSMSCSSCHLPQGAFTDNLAVSEGVDGIAGKRSSMSLVNLGFNHNGFFWDSRSPTLEEQALLPVEDEIELHNNWGDVVCKLTKHEDYPTRFRTAFGIEDKNEITKELAAKAIAQFERSLISANSDFDKFRRGELEPTTAQYHGHDMYFFEEFGYSGIPDAGCSHCHGGFLLTDNEIVNNGLQEAATLEDFEDRGLGAVTDLPGDNGKFRTPTLRNIALTAPYMHDGRFETLEEVIDHYSSGGNHSPNVDGDILPLNLDSTQKADLLIFLHMFTDTSFVNNPDHSNPFE